jgi:predicted phage tail protein
MEVKETPSQLKNAIDLIYHPHPVTPVAGRQTKHALVKEGTTIREIVYASGVDPLQPIYVWLDDRLLTVEEWDSVVPKANQIINVKATVQGGGGGGGGSNALQIVAMVALIVVAVLVQQYELIPAIMGMSAATTSAIAAGVILVAGGAIISSVFAAQMPSLSMAETGGTYSQPSATYSLSGGSNRQRQYESMPVIMGQHRFFPDVSAKPFTEYKGEDQYLYQIFNLGLSNGTITDYRIGNNLITNYFDYTWTDSNADGKILSFPGNVDSASGASLEYSAGWITRTTSTNTNRIGIDIEGTLYYANTGGGLDSTTVELELEYKLSSSSTWLSPSKLTVNNPGFITGDLETYSVWVTSGDWYCNDEYCWYQDTSHYESRQRWATAGNNIRITGNSQSPRRGTIFLDVTSGQYDVRIRRLTADSTDARLQNRTNWSTIRSYQDDQGNYAGQLRRGLTIRASEQLNGVVQQLSCQFSAKAYYWNGSAWTFGATSNPAHWFADFAIGRKDKNGKLVYGIGLTAAQLDLDAIAAWATFCSNEGLTFNAVLDDAKTAAEVITSIARCGFGSPSWASGKLGVVWDSRNASPVAAFGMSNILKGSFNVSYITEQLAEEIIVRYVNPNKDWSQDEVRVLVPGVTTPSRSSTIDVWGCTSTSMAGKFANYVAAQQYYRRRRITWDCDFEGFVCQRGDVVLLSHDLTQWGYSGRIVAVDGNTLTIDREVPRNGSIEYLMLKEPDGTMTTYSVTAGSGNSNELTLTTTPQFQAGYLPLDHVWFFSPLATPGKKVKILSIQPTSETRVQIVATDEDPEFYTAWDGSWNEPASSTLLPAPQIPVIENISISERLAVVASGDIVTRVTISWNQVSSQVDTVQVRYKLNDGIWLSKIAYGVTDIEVDFDGYGTVYAEAMPIAGINIGATITGSGIVYGKTLPPSDVSGFTATVDKDIGLRLAWNSVPDIDIDNYEVRLGSSWASAALYGNIKANTIKVGFLPEGTQTWLIKAVDTSGNYSTNAASVTSTILEADAPTITATYAGPNLVMSWDAVSGSLATQSYEIRYGSDWASGTVIGQVKATTFSVKAQWSGTRTFFIAAIDLNGNYGAIGSYDAVVLVPSQVDPSQEVIDNNVLLRWGDATQTLPIDYYEVRRGSTYAGSTLIGTVSARYTVIFETTGGTYTYWITGFDAAGNSATPASVTALVNDPPDYELQYDQNSTFSGTKSNFIQENGSIIGPFDTTETWQSHFTSRSWDQPQDQIDAGYPYYLEPTATSGYYEETIDYGTVLNATKITITPTYTVVDGSPVITPKISVRETTSDPWIDYDGLSSVYVTNFRYVKYRFTVTGNGNDLVRFTNINVRFDVKLKSDAGVIAANAADSGGTTVYFNKSFVDVISITATPKGTGKVFVLYDFTDVPNPTYFKVYAYDYATGNRASCDVSWSVKGV